MSRQTNVEFITDMMEFGPRAPIAQVFIMEAIRRYARDIAHCHPRDLPGMQGGPISAEAWIATGKEIHEKMEKRLG